MSTGGNRYVLGIVDAYSGYVWIRGLPSKEGSVVAESMKRFLVDVKQYGAVHVIRSDNGKEFDNAQWAKLMVDSGYTA